MNKKTKKILIGAGALVLLGGVYYFYTRKKDESTISTAKGLGGKGGGNGSKPSTPPAGGGGTYTSPPRIANPDLKPQVSPIGCPQLYDPVCATLRDKNGNFYNKTFPNECEAKSSDNWVKGRLRKGECSDVESTPEQETFCTRIYQPVCGSDGNTYGNACEAEKAGVSIASQGKCEESSGGSNGGSSDGSTDNMNISRTGDAEVGDTSVVRKLSYSKASLEPTSRFDGISDHVEVGEMLTDLD